MGEVTARLVGGLQVIGGGLEIALGVGAVAVPEPVSTAGGVILIAHGGDTVIAGFRSLWYGEVAQTATQQVASGTARALGASEGTANLIGTGVDMAAGIGPSVAITVSRRIAISAATSDAPRVMVAYIKGSAMQPAQSIGHNMVGISNGSGIAWFELLGKNSVRFMRSSAPDAGYIITPLRVTPAQADNATAAAIRLTQTLGRGSGASWSIVGPNCTTTATEVLRNAGIIVPAWSVSPFLLSTGARAGAEITVLGATAASGSAAVRGN